MNPVNNPLALITMGFRPSCEGPEGPPRRGLWSGPSESERGEGRLDDLLHDWDRPSCDQDRDFGELHDLVSHAAEEQALNVGESAGSHHDEADVVRRGSIDYGSGHLAHSHIA